MEKCIKFKNAQQNIGNLNDSEKGKDTMKEFDNIGYEAEVKKRWGNTDAYREHKQKTADYTEEKWQSASDGLNAIFVKFAECLKDGVPPESEKAQALACELQEYITENYYTCTKEILAGLGQMYIADERFKQNIDKAADGAAAFTSEAIKIYCSK